MYSFYYPKHLWVILFISGALYYIIYYYISTIWKLPKYFSYCMALTAKISSEKQKSVKVILFLAFPCLRCLAATIAWKPAPPPSILKAFPEGVAHTTQTHRVSHIQTHRHTNTYIHSYTQTHAETRPSPLFVINQTSDSILTFLYYPALQSTAWQVIRQEPSWRCFFYASPRHVFR